MFDPAETEIRIPLRGTYRIAQRFAGADCKAEIANGVLTITQADGAYALYLRA